MSSARLLDVAICVCRCYSSLASCTPVARAGEVNDISLSGRNTQTELKTSAQIALHRQITSSPRPLRAHQWLDLILSFRRSSTIFSIFSPSLLCFTGSRYTSTLLHWPVSTLPSSCDREQAISQTSNPHLLCSHFSHTLWRHHVQSGAIYIRMRPPPEAAEVPMSRKGI